MQRRERESKIFALICMSDTKLAFNASKLSLFNIEATQLLVII